MLELTVRAQEYYDDNTSTFINIPEQKIQLEHSLYTISKWEEKWRKAFLGHREKTIEETNDYIRCMTITPNVNPMVYLGLTPDQKKQIGDYIEDPACATCLPKKSGDGSRDTITAELIYYWMVSLQIPFECQHWHLNRLLTLIRVCDMKNNPSQNKMSKRDIMRQNSSLNALRRSQYHSKG